MSQFLKYAAFTNTAISGSGSTLIAGPIDISQWDKAVVELYLDASIGYGTASLLVTSVESSSNTPLISSIYQAATAAAQFGTGSHSAITNICAKLAYVEYAHTSGSVAATPKVVVTFK